MRRFMRQGSGVNKIAAMELCLFAASIMSLPKKTKQGNASGKDKVLRLSKKRKRRS